LLSYSYRNEDIFRSPEDTEMICLTHSSGSLVHEVLSAVSYGLYFDLNLWLKILSRLKTAVLDGVQSWFSAAEVGFPLESSAFPAEDHYPDAGSSTHPES